MTRIFLRRTTLAALVSLLGLGTSISQASTVGTPNIYTLTPSTGPAGTVVMVKGSGFQTINRATVGAVSAAVRLSSSTTVFVTVPSTAVSGAIGLANSQHSTTSSIRFTVTGSTPTNTKPSISGFTPTIGPAGTTVTVSGSSLTGAKTANVGSSAGINVTAISSSSLRFVVPSDATTGTIRISNGSISGSSSSAYTVAVAPPAPPPSNGSLSIRVQGNQLIDKNGLPVQLRGVNVSGLETVAIQGWSPSNPWGGQTGDATPNWQTIKTWHTNAVRLPLNEASWLGYTTRDQNGASRNPDPGGNYRQTVTKSVADAVAAGFYVILDLHWTAPGTFTPYAQNPMADADHSIDFWNSIASTFKNNPAVMFDLFNEPFFGNFFNTQWLDSGANEWQVLRDGGYVNSYVAGGNPYTVAYRWKTAGTQSMLNAVRATGATNVVLVSGLNFTSQLDQWLTWKPSDPQGQLAASWHAYPNYADATVPQQGAAEYNSIAAILSANVPVVISELGDPNGNGTSGSPLVSRVLPWADSHGASYTGWTWNPWGNAENVLIKDASGTPTDGYGKYYQQHLACRASGTNSCP